MLRVLVWDEGGEGGPAVTTALMDRPGVSVTLTGPADPDQGTSPAALAEAGVVVWRGGPETATSLTDRAARRVVAAVGDRGVGFVVLPMGFPGKPAGLLLDGISLPDSGDDWRGVVGKGRVCRLGGRGGWGAPLSEAAAERLRAAVCWCGGGDR